MRKKEWILVLDSGIGGLWTLGELKRAMPNENFLFFMDKTHSPYGNKSKKRLCKLVCDNIRSAKKLFQIKIIVLACNTISCVCYKKICTEFFDIPVTKIQPFCDYTAFQNKPTLVLSTKNTAKYCEQIAEISKRPNVYAKSFDTLAKKIDDVHGNFDLLLPLLKTELAPFASLHIKNVVLGCTHYNFLKNQLTQIFGKVKFFENSTSCAKKTKDILQKTCKLSHQKYGETIILSNFPSKRHFG